MADFTVLDKFNPAKGFINVAFQNGVFLLEAELNELQKIQNYQRVLLARTLLTNGFTNKPAMLLSGGILTIPPDTVVIDGNIIEILENMTIAVDTGDTVYLSVSEDEIGSLAEIRTSGNLSGGSLITNDLIDSRVGAETTHRIQKQVQLVKSNADTSKVYLSAATITGVDTFTDSRVSLGMYSPALLGIPTVPTAAPGTSTTQAASTAFVEAVKVALVASDAAHQADYAQDTGTANTYAITLNPVPVAYEIGKIYKFKAANANTGASTFAIGALAVTSIKKNVSVDLAVGDILINQIVTVIFDGTNFQMITVNIVGDGAWENILIDNGTTIVNGTLTLSSDTARVDLSSIASGYKKFKVIFTGNIVTGSQLQMGVNDSFNLTGAYISTNGSIGVGTLNTEGMLGTVGSTTLGKWGSANIEICNVIGKPKPFTYVTADGNTNYWTGGGVATGVTAEITKLSFRGNAGSIAAGSTFTLWGAKS